MLTPAFSLSQNKDSIIIHIKAPFAKITDTEIFIEDTEFRFHSKPYFLRLNLPGCIEENGAETGQYDSDTGSFTITVPKRTPGEEFEGLDMITKLLTPKGEIVPTPSIEVIEKESNADNQSPSCVEESEENKDDACVEEFDWHIEQEPYREEAISLDAPKYGFANQRSGVFKILKDEVYDTVDITDPDSVHATKRRQLRTEAEDRKFDPDYYLGDLFEDDAIQEVMKYKTPWSGTSEHNICKEFTEEDKESMRKLPRKEYLVDQSTEKAVYLGLVDILCAYAYNGRTTEGENTVESGWTISKLSATLSWLEVFRDLQDVAVSFMRRSLCYPLYRNWNLSLMVLNDTTQILQKGRREVLGVLLEIRTLFQESYPRYVLNDLYITDYCVWIQSASNVQLESLGKALKSVSLQKGDIGLNLCTVEQMAAQDDETDLATAVARVKIQSGENDSDDEASTESDDENTGSDDESTGSDDENTESDDENTESSDVNTKSDDIVVNDEMRTYRGVDGEPTEHNLASRTDLCDENKVVTS